MPMSKGKRQRQTTLFAQLQLLNDLKALNPLDHKSIRKATETALYVLICLSIDYNHFPKHILDFIGCALSFIEIEKPIEKYGSLQK